jgi:hypothetical protein
MTMKDGDIGDGSADGPMKFHKEGYCRFCGCERLIYLVTLRCAECHTKNE